MKNKIKIVIIGGGFGGVYSAINLIKKFDGNEIEITLINKNNYFLFTPLLHEVATGALTPDSIVEPIREVFRNFPINFVEDTVLEIKKDKKEIITKKGQLSYDYLVIAPGAETNYMNVPGASEYTFTLKNLQYAISIRNHVLGICEIANEKKDKSLLNFTVIGAGATGVELVSELVEYIQHTMCNYYRDSGFKEEDIIVNLVSASAEIIPQFPVKMREVALKELKKKNVTVYLNTKVVKIEPKKIYIDGDKTIDTNTIIWVAGVKPSANSILGITVGEKGRIDADEYLKSIQDESIYCLGDSSGTLPMLAQIAVQQAKIVALNIYNSTHKLPLKKFTFTQKGLLISLGQWYAAGNFFGMTFSGKIMWWVWRTVYLFNFLSWRKRFEIAIEWTIDLFYPRDISLIK